MMKIKQIIPLLIFITFVTSFSTSAFAECGGKIQCIGIGTTPTDALDAHHGSIFPPVTPNFVFGNQDIGTTSVAQTVYVQAVTSPSGATVVLNTPFIDGSDPSAYSVTGGTCLVSGPVHGDSTAYCTITIAFNPSSVGSKPAILHVPLPQASGCGTCITERTANLSGNATLPAPVITSTSTTSGSTGVAFSYQIVANNSPTSFNATSLPTGLSVNTSTGLISGTPTANGISNVSISATNATGTDTQTLALTIALNVPVITSSGIATGTTGVAFTYQITATNIPWINAQR